MKSKSCKTPRRQSTQYRPSFWLSIVPTIGPGLKSMAILNMDVALYLADFLQYFLTQLDKISASTSKFLTGSKFNLFPHLRLRISVNARQLRNYSLWNMECYIFIEEFSKISESHVYLFFKSSRFIKNQL